MRRPVLILALMLAGSLAARGQEDALPLPRALPPPVPEQIAPPPPLPPLPAADTAPRIMPVAPVPPRAPATASSTSSSGQFIVHGADLRVRNGLATRCEEINRELSRLLRASDPWVSHIVVQIKPPSPGDPPDIGITSQIRALEHGGFHLQLSVPERTGLRPADFRRELIRLLLAERILRSHKQLTDERAQMLPAWVHTGVLKALDFKLRTRPSAEFAAIFKSGQIYGIEEILDTAPAGLDGLSRTIYETSCCALVLALLDQPEGPLRFGRFLSALAVETRPERELLRQWFPGLAESDASLDKWWSLQLAQLASPGLTETLDPVASAELLDRALTFQLPQTPEKKLPAPRQVIAIASQRPQPPPEEPAPALAAASAPSASGNEPPTPTPAKKTSPPKPAAKTVSNRPRDIPAAPRATATAAVEDKENEEDRPGFLRRMFSFGRSDSDDEGEADAAAPAKTKDAPTEQAKPAKTQDTPPAEKKPEPAPKKAEDTPPAPKKEQPAKAEPKPAEKTKPEPAAEKPAEEDRGSGRFNPLNWFRGGKKEKADEPAPQEDGKKTGNIHPVGVKALADHSERPLRAESKEQGAGRDALRPALCALPFADRLKASLQPTPADPRIVRDILGRPRGRYIQAAADPASPLPAADRADLLELPPIVAPPPQQPPPASPAPLLAPVTVETAAYPIEDYALILAHPDRDRLLDQARLALKDLAARGNVLFREIAKDYLTAIEDLAAGKTKGMDARLAALRRKAIDTFVKACAVQDHLDWYEATRSERFSGLFEDFLTLPERIDEELPSRNDPLSKHLDEIEARFGR